MKVEDFKPTGQFFSLDGPIRWVKDCDGLVFELCQYTASGLPVFFCVNAPKVPDIFSDPSDQLIEVVAASIEVDTNGKLTLFNGEDDPVMCGRLIGFLPNTPLTAGW